MRTRLSLTFVLLASPALATPIDFSQLIRGANNEPVKMCEAKTPECQRDLTLGMFTSMTLAVPNQSPGQQPASMTMGQAPDDNVRAGNLAIELYSGGKHDLSHDDIAFVEQYIRRYPAPVFVARAIHLLESSHAP